MARIPRFASNPEKKRLIIRKLNSTTTGCNIELRYIDISLTSSEDIFKISHDGEDRDVEVVPLPFSSRLEKME